MYFSNYHASFLLLFFLDIFIFPLKRIFHETLPEFLFPFLIINITRFNCIESYFLTFP